MPPMDDSYRTGVAGTRSRDILPSARRWCVDLCDTAVSPGTGATVGSEARRIAARPAGGRLAAQHHLAPGESEATPACTSAAVKHSSLVHKPVVLLGALLLMGQMLSRPPLMLQSFLGTQSEQGENKSAAEETSDDSIPLIASGRRLKWTMPSSRRPMNVNARIPRSSRVAIRPTPRDYVDPRLALLPRRAETPPPDPEG